VAGVDSAVYRLRVAAERKTAPIRNASRHRVTA
jgi:hypothetical protein